MILLFDIGNTHTHLGLAGRSRVVRQTNILTADWFDGTAQRQVEKFVRRAPPLEGASLCSVSAACHSGACASGFSVAGAFQFLNWARHRHWCANQIIPNPKTIGPDSVWLMP